MNENIIKSIMYVADAVETGYSSVFTFGVKEILNTSERKELAQLLRDLSASQTIASASLSRYTSTSKL